LGRSRGGLSTKIHLLADARCRPLQVVTTAGQRHDSLASGPLLDDLSIKRPGRGRPRRGPDALLADKGCSNKAIRHQLRERRITPVIPLKSEQLSCRRWRGSRGRLPGFDPEAYRQRNVVERAVAAQRTRRRHRVRQAPFRLPRQHGRRINQDLATRPHPTRYAGQGVGAPLDAVHGLVDTTPTDRSSSRTDQRSPPRRGRASQDPTLGTSLPGSDHKR